LVVLDGQQRTLEQQRPSGSDADGSVESKSSRKNTKKVNRRDDKAKLKGGHAQKEGAALIERPAPVVESKTVLRDVGAIPALVLLLCSPRPKVQLMACAVLRSLAYHDPANQDALRKADGIAVLVRLVQMAYGGQGVRYFGRDHENLEQHGQHLHGESHIPGPQSDGLILLLLQQGQGKTHPGGESGEVSDSMGGKRLLGRRHHHCQKTQSKAEREQQQRLRRQQRMQGDDEEELEDRSIVAKAAEAVGRDDAAADDDSVERMRVARAAIAVLMNATHAIASVEPPDTSTDTPPSMGTAFSSSRKGSTRVVREVLRRGGVSALLPLLLVGVRHQQHQQQHQQHQQQQQQQQQQPSSLGARMTSSSLSSLPLSHQQQALQQKQLEHSLGVLMNCTVGGCDCSSAAGATAATRVLVELLRGWVTEQRQWQRQQHAHLAQQRRGLRQRLKQPVQCWAPLSERGLEYATGALWNLSLCSNTWPALRRAGAVQTLREVLDVLEQLKPQDESASAPTSGASAAGHAAKAVKALAD
jgi:hypothetical protein